MGPLAVHLAQLLPPLAQESTLSQVLQYVQLALGIFTLAGAAFALGVLFNKVETLRAGQQAIQESLFGGDDQRGMFLRRAEAELMVGASVREREALARRVDELTQRLGEVDGRVRVVLEAQRHREE